MLKPFTIWRNWAETSCDPSEVMLPMKEMEAIKTKVRARKRALMDQDLFNIPFTFTALILSSVKYNTIGQLKGRGGKREKGIVKYLRVCKDSGTVLHARSKEEAERVHAAKVMPLAVKKCTNSGPIVIDKNIFPRT